jgi:hypothetical protein
MTKILLSLHSSNSETDCASYALVELVPAQARKLLELHRRVRAFLAEVAGDGLVSEFFAPSFGLTNPAFAALRYTDKLAEFMGGSEERLHVLDAKESVDTSGEDAQEAVECFRIFVREGSVTFTAVAKHGDHLLTAADIPVELLIRVASSPN